MSGWGERFVFVQPHNLCFWVYLALTAVGVFQAGPSSTPRSASTPRASRSRRCSAASAVSRGGSWFRHIDRWERQPGGLVVAGLVWGAIPATFGVRDDGQHRDARHLPQAVRPGLDVPTGPRCHRALHRGGSQALRLRPADGPGAPAGPDRERRPGHRRLHRARVRRLRGLPLRRQLHATAFGTDPVGNAVHMSAPGSPSASSRTRCSAPWCAAASSTCSAPPPSLDGSAAGSRSILAGMFFHFTWDDAVRPGHGVVRRCSASCSLSTVLGFTVLSIAFRAAAPASTSSSATSSPPKSEAGTLPPRRSKPSWTSKARKSFKRSAPTHRAQRARKHLRRAVLDLTHDVADARGGDDRRRPAHPRRSCEASSDRRVPDVGKARRTKATPSALGTPRLLRGAVRWQVLRHRGPSGSNKWRLDSAPYQFA